MIALDRAAASRTEMGDAAEVRASVVVVAYNGRAYLESCLGSLRAAGGGVEVIVIDNASLDGSADYVEDSFPWVRVVRLDRNRGYGHGCNVGARLATGEYLAFLNQDAVVEPGWLEALIAALEANPRAGLVTPKVLLLDHPDRINTAGNDVHLTGLTLCRGAGLPASAMNDPAAVGAVSGAAFCMRRGLFNELGGFDRSLFMYMEDTDLSLRARLAGYGCLYVPQSVVYHDYALRFGPQKVFYQERSRYAMLLKSLRWRTLLALLPALLLGEAVTWGFVLVRARRHLGNKVRAYSWVARHWSELLARRRRVQEKRRCPDRDWLARCTYRLDFEQTGGGPVAWIAHLVFDPLFWLCGRWAGVLCGGRA